ncbi:response regulator transcription factor [Nonomuraea sediminis]|uniref:response regulator transcription factor n=1 Tax=Nonomuraea sediminis TaxID=2835864 RepID=UPI002029F592|nr:response regulator transcription factor [Nonomuraea sediminis]
MTVRVLVVDDQAVVREGLVLVLELLPGIDVVGSAGDGEAALALVATEQPDVVLMDLRMPRMDGVEATRRIRTDHPATQVVVLTTYADDDSVFAALRAGARGFLTKSADSDEIAKAITTVMRGDAQLDPAVQRRLLETMTHPATTTTPHPTSTTPAAYTQHTDPGATETDHGPRREARAGDPQELRGGASAHPDSRRIDRPGHPDSRHVDRPAYPDSRRADRPAHPGTAGVGLPDGLTPREAEVLSLIAEGLSNSEIAGRLFISEATVKTHINNLFTKAHLRDRAQAVRYAYRHGFA